MTKSSYRNPRIDHAGQQGNPSAGTIKLELSKVVWVGGMVCLGLIGVLYFPSVHGFSVFVVSTLCNICLGHSLGMHRLLIHRSFSCPKWLEYFLVHVGTVAGIAGPLTMMRTHDVRDWAQRQIQCHAFYSQLAPWHLDLGRQLFCRIELNCPPSYSIEANVADDPVYLWMERTWMWQQLPWIALLFGLGGFDWVLWGVCLRVGTIVTGHWLIGYFAHNFGLKSWEVRGAAVQGQNIPWCSVLTMGECWHNNHHAFPGSAKLGLESGQWDPGWMVLQALHKIGWVTGLITPEDLSARSDLRRVSVARAEVPH